MIKKVCARDEKRLKPMRGPVLISIVRLEINVLLIDNALKSLGKASEPLRGLCGRGAGALLP